MLIRSRHHNLYDLIIAMFTLTVRSPLNFCCCNSLHVVVQLSTFNILFTLKLTCPTGQPVMNWVRAYLIRIKRTKPTFWIYRLFVHNFTHRPITILEALQSIK